MKYVLRSRYARIAVLVAAVLVLVVEGYFVYRWYERYYGASAADAAVSGVPSPETTVGAGGASEGPGSVALVHRSAAENIVQNSTYVDHPAANGNPEAVILATQAWEPGGIAGNAHPIGVWYDENRGGRWAIFNQDLAPMPEDAVFNVVISEEPGSGTFVHRVTPANAAGESTYIDHPSVNASPGAVLSVTPNWNPGGGSGTYADHPVSVWYDADQERWAIRNEDLATIPENAAFNVSVLRGSP